MKSLSKLFMACGLIVGLAACNKELAPQQELPSAANKETIKLAFTVSVPSTRSATDSKPEGQTPSNAAPDYEVGKPIENAINTVQLVLVDANRKIVAASNPKATTVNSADASQVKYLCPFNSAELIEASAAGAQVLDVYAFINNNYSDLAPEELVQLKGQAFNTEMIYNLATAPVKIWDAAPGFFMSNAEKVQFELPEQKILLSKYKDQPLNIGTIPVERLAARFDINVNALEHKIEGQPYQVKFTEIGLSNVSKETYILRRVSMDGLNKVTSTEFTGLLGAELNNNYLCDVNAAKKDTYAVENKVLTPEQEQELFTEVTPVYAKLSDIANGGEKNDDTWTGDPAYKIWRYATENVLPAPSAKNNQFENLTTNVSFKGELTALKTAPAPVQAAFTAKQSIFVYDGKLYGNKATLERAAKGWPVDESKTASDLAQDPTIEHYPANGALEAAYLTAEDLAAKEKITFEEACKKNERFEVFVNKDGVYPIYYLYGNKHNDNADINASCPMEYAVVRNNVYKLQVAKVYSFGTPDFEKGKPQPWEKGDAAFEVYVTVLPWTVRVNNIEF